MTALARTLHEIGYGIIIVDSHGTVVHSNRLGAVEFERQPFLSTCHGRLVTAQSAQQSKLVAALARACTGRRTLLQLGHDSAAQMYLLIPLEAESADRATANAVDAVLILCSRQQPFEALTLAMFSSAVGLTLTEQAVLTDLCNGLAVSDIADRQSICVSTVRTHVSHIREKTGTHSVLQLIRRVITLPHVLGRML